MYRQHADLTTSRNATWFALKVVVRLRCGYASCVDGLLSLKRNQHIRPVPTCDGINNVARLRRSRHKIDSCSQQATAKEIKNARLAAFRAAQTPASRHSSPLAYPSTTMAPQSNPAARRR